MKKQDDYSHSVAIAELALARIKLLNQSAEPPSYEVWYNYFAGDNPALNCAIDSILARDDRLSDVDLNDIRQRYFPGINVTDRIGHIGQEIGDEVEQVIGMIEAAIGVAVDYNNSLTETNQKLSYPIDRQTLRSIIEAVVVTTKEMQHENSELSVRLKESRQDIVRMEEELTSVRMESLTDPLTSLANRRQFDHHLRTAIVEAERTKTSLSLMMADIDRFKEFNDNHGHLIGDHVLRLVANRLKQSVKGQDFVARYGGEEFALVLPNTAVREAVIVANNVRSAVAAQEIVKRSSGEALGRITISIGVASFRAGMTAQSLINAADDYLYAAKKNGRNCVMSEMDLTSGMSSDQ